MAFYVSSFTLSYNLGPNQSHFTDFEISHFITGFFQSDMDAIVINIFVRMEGLFGQMQMQMYAGGGGDKKGAGSQMWPKNWRRCEPAKKTLEIPLGRPIVTCCSQKSSTYCAGMARVVCIEISG